MLKAGLAVIVWGYIAMTAFGVVVGILLAVTEPTPQERREAKVAEQLRQQPRR